MIDAIEQQADVDTLLARTPVKVQEYAQVFPAEVENVSHETEADDETERQGKKRQRKFRQQIVAARAVDPDGERAERCEALQPVLDETEKERRSSWLLVDPELRRDLRTQHCNLGHPTNAALCRLLRRQGAAKAVLDACKLLACDACGAAVRRGPLRPSRMPGRYQVGYNIGVDVFYETDATGETFAFLNINDDGSNFQVVGVLKAGHGTPSPASVVTHFCQSWSS